METVIVNGVLHARRGRIGEQAVLLSFRASVVRALGRLWDFLWWFGAGREHVEAELGLG